VLKNAVDHIYAEWAQKPVGFLSYGNTGGARAVEQLRLVAVEMQMWPIRSAIHLPVDMYLAVMNEPVPANPELLEPLKKGRVNVVERFFKELVWAARALKQARAGGVA
jgi:NAD(P)H-dependent FMN reductase